MGLSLWVVTFAAAIVLFCSIFMALHQHYDTGLLGALGLSMVALAAAGRILFVFEHQEKAYVSPLAFFVWVGLALFLANVVYRFHLRMRAKDWYNCQKRGQYGRSQT